MLKLYLIAVNAAAFLLFAVDKYKAKHDLWRIPEKTLLGVAAIGGSVGAYIGMRVAHHKTRKPAFYIGIPVMFFLQLALYQFLIKRL